MPGPNRRSKRLKQTTELTDISQFSSVNPTEGDLLVFDAVEGVYENQKALTGNYSFTGTQTITGSLSVSDDITVSDSLTVSGNANLDADLAVAGDAALNSSLSVGTTLSVTGAATLSDTLDVAGAVSVAGFSASGASTFGDTVGVTGVLTASGGISTPSLTGLESLTVIGLEVATILATEIATDNLSVSGGIALEDLTTSGTATVNDLSIRGGLGTISHDLTNLDIENAEEDGLIRFYGNESVGSTQVLLMTMDPVGPIQVFHPGSTTEPALETHSQGITVHHPDDNNNTIIYVESAAATNPSLFFQIADTNKATVQYQDTNNRMRFRTIDADDAFLFVNDTDGTYWEASSGQMAWHGNTPISQPDYTLNTFATDRNLTSSGSVTLSEVADVLATLIQDLTDYGLLQ